MKKLKDSGFMKKYLILPLVSGLIGFSILFTMTVVYKLSSNLLPGAEQASISSLDAISSLHGFWVAALAGLVFALFGDVKEHAKNSVPLGENQL